MIIDTFKVKNTAFSFPSLVTFLIYLEYIRSWFQITNCFLSSKVIIKFNDEDISNYRISFAQIHSKDKKEKSLRLYDLRKNSSPLFSKRQPDEKLNEKRLVFFHFSSRTCIPYTDVHTVTYNDTQIPVISIIPRSSTFPQSSFHARTRIHSPATTDQEDVNAAIVPFLYSFQYSLPSFSPLATLDHPFLVVSLFLPSSDEGRFSYTQWPFRRGRREGGEGYSKGQGTGPGTGAKKRGRKGRPREECEFFNFMRDVYLMIMLITSR